MWYNADNNQFDTRFREGCLDICSSVAYNTCHKVLKIIHNETVKNTVRSKITYISK